MRERNAGVAAGGLGGRDARHDFIRHAGRFERRQLLGQRAKIVGSPPLSRTTVRPARAWRIIASLISACDISRPWPCRPRQTSSASGRVRRQATRGLAR